MKHTRIALLTTLLLLPAARVWAAPQYDYAGQPNELYHAEVCNQGSIAVDVAVAYKDFGFNDEFWVIDYWYRVTPGKCKVVFQHFYAPNNLFNFQKFPLYLAFSFTDSTGVSGAAKVSPPRGTAASRVNLCASRENYKYRVNGKTPEAPRCPKGPVPVSFVWEPTQGVYPNVYSREYPPPMRFTVALGPNDRAIPVGPQALSTPPTQGPGKSDEFATLLRVAMNAVHYSEETVGPGGYVQLKPGYRWVSVCASRPVVAKESLSNLQTARAKALTNAIKEFLASHTRGKIGFRVTEPNGVFALQQFSGKTEDCVDRGDLQFQFQSAEAGAAPAPKPAPKAAPEPNPGFGDLMGPGGFIKPLPPK